MKPFARSNTVQIRLLPIVFGFALLCPSVWGQQVIRPASKWEPDIQAFERSDRTNPPPKGGVLFIGSSSIRLWKTLARDFPGQKVINRGFGGSHIADSIEFAERIVFPYEPKKIVFFAGINDLHAGKPPEQVFTDFKTFVAKVKARLPNVPIAFISVNPAPSRWSKAQQMRKLNKLVEEYARENPQVTFINAWRSMVTPEGQPREELFVDDRLHLNAKGYELWRSLVRPWLEH